MWPKYIAQVVVSATQAVGRAFSRAIREEMRQSRQAAANQSNASSNENASSSQESLKSRTMTNLKLGMSLQEAVQILNLDKNLINAEEAEKRFKHLFDINEKAKGGSFYLQSKVYMAKKRIDAEMESRGEKLCKDRATDSSGG